MNTPKQRTIKSGPYTFPMKMKDRDRVLNSMTPDARAWFYERETAALQTLRQQADVPTEDASAT